MYTYTYVYMFIIQPAGHRDETQRENFHISRRIKYFQHILRFEVRPYPGFLFYESRAVIGSKDFFRRCPNAPIFRALIFSVVEERRPFENTGARNQYSRLVCTTWTIGRMNYRETVSPLQIESSYAPMRLQRRNRR